MEIDGIPLDVLRNCLPMREIDDDVVVSFFQHIFQFCQTGYLHLVPWPIDEDHDKLFFDISEGFKEIPKFIKDHQEKTFPRSYFFDLNLYLPPEYREENVCLVPMIQADIDFIPLEAIEAGLSKYNLWPPSSIVKTRGKEFFMRAETFIPTRTPKEAQKTDRYNLYWILATPIKPCIKYLSIMQRIYKVCSLGKIYEYTGLQLHARIPGIDNFWGESVPLETLDRFFELKDFSGLPGLSLLENLSYFYVGKKFVESKGAVILPKGD